MCKAHFTQEFPEDHELAWALGFNYRFYSEQPTSLSMTESITTATQESQKSTADGQLSNAETHVNNTHVTYQERQRDCILDEHTMAYPSSKLSLTGSTTGIFAINKQNPTAHLNILRDPSKWYHYGTPAYSPALGNASDVYIRLQQSNYRQLNIAKWELFNFPMVPWQLATIDQNPAAELYNQLCQFINHLKSKNRGWAINSLPIDRLIQGLDNERDFWRVFGENRNAETDESVQTNIKWIPNNEATTFGEQLEAYMNEEGYSLDDMDRLQHAVMEAEAAERHEKMLQHREQWCQNNKVMKMETIIDDNDEKDDTLYMTDNNEINTMSTTVIDEEHEEPEEDDDNSHLCSFASPPSLTTSDSEGEVIANAEHSLATHAQIEISDIYPGLSTTQTPRVQAWQPESHNKIHMHSAILTATMNAEDKAIFKLARALVDDLTIRRTAYMYAANLSFNTAFYKLWPQKPLRSKCTWIPRPLAMTPKNREPPSANHLPLIRVITPEGIACELIESFEDFSHPDWVEIFKEREDEQDEMQANLDQWRDEMDSFSAYERRLECEKFWEECRVKDSARCMEEERLRCQEEEDYESDEEEEEEDDDGSSFGHLSRTTTVTSMESTNDTTKECTKTENTSSLAITDEEIDRPTALEQAQANLAEFNTLLAKCVTVVKAETLSSMREAFIDGPARIIAEQEAIDRAGSFKKFEVSIIKLKLRIHEDGLLATDPNKIRFKSTATTGPAEVQFVGPLRDLLAASHNGGIFYNSAFKLLKHDKEFMALRCRDMTWLIKELLKKVKDPYETKDAKFKEALKEKEEKTKEADEKIWSAIRCALKRVEKGVAKRKEKRGRERERKNLGLLKAMLESFRETLEILKAMGARLD